MSPARKTGGTSTRGHRPAAARAVPAWREKRQSRARGPRRRNSRGSASRRTCRSRPGRSPCAGSSAASREFRLKNVGDEPLFSEFEVTNPADQADLSRGDPRPGAGRELLLLPRLRRQHAGHLQAHRVRAGAAGAAAAAARAALALGFQPPYSRGLSAVRRPARGRLPARDRVPRRAARRYARRYFDDQGRLPADGFAGFHGVPEEGDGRRARGPLLRRRAGVHRRGPRPGERSRERIDEAFPHGIRSAAFKNCSRRSSIPISAKGRCSRPRRAGA